MEIPSANQINPHDDLDGRDACKHFLGKTLEQAEALFLENAYYYQQDLMWMGPIAFRYYVLAAIRFIKGRTKDEQSGFINDFAGTLEFRMEYESDELVPVADELAALCKYIIDSYDRVGDVPETKEKSEALTESMRKALGKNKEVAGGSSHKPEDYVDLRPRYFALWEAFFQLADDRKK